MMPTGESRSLRPHLTALLVWTLLWALFFCTILAGIEHLPAGDFSGQFHAFGLFQAREMAQGHLPLWSPGSYGGMPFAADTQAAVYYPPRWLTVLLSLPWGFSYYALELEALLHIWLAGVFAYALGYSLTHESVAALIGAIAFGLGGYLTSYPLLQLAILETITWLPLALLLLRIGVRRSRPVPWLVGAGLTLALSALAGHPQTLVHVSYVAAAYYLYLALRARWSWRWILGLGALVAAVAVGVWSAALWPTLQYLPYTARADVSYQFVSSGLPLLDYVQVLIPGVLSFWSPEYWGLAAVALAVLAVLGRRQSDRAEIGFWGILALLSAWLALGDKGVLFELVYHIAPGFSLFQSQERLMGVFSLGCAMLAAQGAAIWLKMHGASLHALAQRLAYILGASLLLFGVILGMAARVSTAARVAKPSWSPVWAQQLLVLLIVLILLWGERCRRQRAWALALVLGLDLYVSTWSVVGLEKGSPAAFWPQPEWVEAARLETPSRLDSGGLFYGNLGELYGIEDVRGISPLKPQALEDLGKLPEVRRWQLLNVAYVLASSQPSDAPLTQVADVKEEISPGQLLEAGLYRFDAALPRAWMTYRPIWVDDGTEALRLLADASFDPALSVILQGADAGSGQDTAPVQANEPSVRVSRLGPAALRIEVETEAPGYLAISEWYYPGWQAQIDGQRVPIYQADYAFQALQMPAGSHIVSLCFDPPLQKAGILASLLTLLVAALLAWRWRPVVTHRAREVAGHTARPQTQAMARIWRSGLWPCIALVLLGFGLRALSLGSQELRGDEAFSFLFGRLPLGQIVPELLRQGDPHPPLHYLLLHVWMLLAGDSEFAMRYISLLPSVLLLPLLFQFGRRLGGSRLGVLLAGLAAISQSQVWIAQDLRNQYTLVILFSTLAALLLVRAIERPSWGNWALYAAACILALYSHYYGVFALAAQGLCVLWVPSWRRRLWAWSASVAAVALAFLPWVLAAWPRMTAAGQLSAPSRPELASHLVSVGTELAVGSALGPEAARWLFLGALGLCLLGARELYRRAHAWATLLTVWLSAAVLGIYLLRFSRVTFNTFYVLVASVPWWILVSVGLQWLWQQQNRSSRALAAAALVGLIAANGASLWNHYTNPRYGHTSGYRGLAAQIAVQALPGDVFLSNLPDPCYDYYLRDVPMERTMQPTDVQAAPEDTRRGLVQLATQHDRLWFVSSKGSVWDRKGVVSDWLEYNALLEQETRLGNMLLQAYRPIRTAASAMVPLDRSVAGLLRLKGAHVTVDGVPAEAGATLSVPVGATLKVTLLWQMLSRPQEDYTVFVHLMSEDGRLLAQHDGMLVFNTRPASTWTPGELVLDRHDFVVPPDITAGRISLLVGVYQSDTVARQTWDNGGDTVTFAYGQLVTSN